MLAIPADTGMASGARELCDLRGPAVSDAGNGRQFGVRSRENIEESSKPGEESPRAHGGDTRCSRQRLFGGGVSLSAARPLGIDGSISNGLRSATRGKPQKPAGRIVGVFSTTDRHAEIGHSDQQSANGFGGEAAVVERSAFDEEIWPRDGATQLSDLSPETAVVDRLMQISDGLELDRGGVAKVIVARRQRAHFHRESETNQLGRYSGFPLVNIGCHAHSPSLARKMSRDTRDMEKKASLLAISQGEMA